MKKLPNEKRMTKNQIMKIIELLTENEFEFEMTKDDTDDYYLHMILSNYYLDSRYNSYSDFINNLILFINIDNIDDKYFEI